MSDAPSLASPPDPTLPEVWLTWARENGHTLVCDPYGWANTLGASWPIQGDFFAPLPDWGLIQASGPDARRFMHSQLTQDILHSPPNQARWAGYCSPKGRLLAIMRTWCHEDAVFGLAARPSTAGLVQRLRMFVLRAPVHIVDRSEQFCLLGVGGAALATRAAEVLHLSVPGSDAAQSHADAHLIGLPSCAALADRPRYIALVRPAQLPTLWHALYPHGQLITTASWRATDVLCGVARIVPATTERFIPQMLNLEAVAGVNFKKGCYPGQEIVARTQYLGKLKRRMILAEGRGPLPNPGSDVHVTEQEEPCGQIVVAAPTGEGFVTLLETQLTALEQSPLRVGAQTLTRMALPYAWTDPS